MTVSDLLCTPPAACVSFPTPSLLVALEPQVHVPGPWHYICAPCTYVLCMRLPDDEGVTMSLLVETLIDVACICITVHLVSSQNTLVAGRCAGWPNVHGKKWPYVNLALHLQVHSPSFVAATVPSPPAEVAAPVGVVRAASTHMPVSLLNVETVPLVFTMVAVFWVASQVVAMQMSLRL